MSANNQKIDVIRELLHITERLNHIQDLDSLLDTILLNARMFTGADAGSIYLKEGDHLLFSYTQNDFIARKDKLHNRFVYSNAKIPINTASIAGFVATTGEALNIKDVYDIDKEKTYKFNSNFDTLSGYRTKSILTLPLITSREEIIGVMQIINPYDNNGQIISFTDND